MCVLAIFSGFVSDEWYPLSLSSLMNHWLDCDKHTKPKILTSFSHGTKKWQAGVSEVTRSIKALYGALSSNVHFARSSVGARLLMEPMESDASTLALVTFLTHYDIPFSMNMESIQLPDQAAEAPSDQPASAASPEAFTS